MVMRTYTKEQTMSKDNTDRESHVIELTPNSLPEGRELKDHDLDLVSGGGIKWTYTKQKPDGTAGGNVAAKWSVAQGAAA
jgi:hypothetical protein